MKNKELALAEVTRALQAAVRLKALDPIHAIGFAEWVERAANELHRGERLDKERARLLESFADALRNL